MRNSDRSDRSEQFAVKDTSKLQNIPIFKESSEWHLHLLDAKAKVRQISFHLF